MGLELEIIKTNYGKGISVPVIK